jgi:hypothetical protein
MAPREKKRHEVVVQVPDIGLSKTQLASMKKAFRNQFVSSLGEKADAIIVIVRIRIIVVRAEF